MKLKRFTDSVTAISRSALSISFRLLAFNILLVFLPVAAVLYLDVYETRLLVSQEKTMVQQGRLLSAALAEQGQISREKVESVLKNLAGRSETRLRVLDSEGWLLGDTSTSPLPEKTEPLPNKTAGRYSESTEVVKEVLDQESFLYRLATYPIVVYRKLFNPPAPVAEARYYNSQSAFTGREVQAALAGKYGAITRLSADGQRSVTLYTAIPVYSSGNVVGAVLCSQSTYRILEDLYEIRLVIIRIFLASFLAAIIISLFLSSTISRRIKQLGREARAIRTGKGRIKGSFSSMLLGDEIGDLSRSLIDLTERLDRHIQFIDSLSRDISHEFKNPLAVIRSAADMIGESDGSQQQRFIELITSNTGRMESLLNGVEEISRLDSHLDSEDRENIDAAELIGKLLDGFRLRYPAISWEINVVERKLPVWASTARLSQVFVNLYENAASFSPDDGLVVTTVTAGKHEVRISVYNDGPLIEEEDLEKIFDRFFSTREEDKDRHHGLGLSIVRTIVSSYGGTVEASNREDGVVFTVILPLVIF